MEEMVIQRDVKHESWRLSAGRLVWDLDKSKLTSPVGRNQGNHTCLLPRSSSANTELHPKVGEHVCA